MINLVEKNCFVWLIIIHCWSGLCFYADDIIFLIIGRIVQGLGAISSVGVATLSENTSEENRASAFTIMGITVGVTFVIGFIAGPFFTTIYSFQSLFILLFFFGIVASLITFLYYPEDKNKLEQNFSIKISFNDNLIQIYVGSFFLSLVLSIMLYIYPLSWKSLGAGSEELFIIYLKIFLPSALLIYPSVRFFEKINKVNVIVRLGWLFLNIWLFCLLLNARKHIFLICLGYFIFLGHISL